jgi:hypothetical protein
MYEVDKIESLPESKFERALALKTEITTVAEGGTLDQPVYMLLRGELADDPATKRLLPKFVVRSYDHGAIWSEMKDVHSGGGAYAARRNFLRDEFAPLLEYLETGGSAADAAITAGLTSYDAPAVQAVWTKALERRSTDPEGAVTAACTLLEEVCKHIIEDSGGEWETKWNIPKLYGQAAQLLNLAPSQHQGDVFKTILGSCQSIVQGVGSLRNKGSDAHAGGRARVPFKPRHAAFTVNLAGSMALFLIETWQARFEGS